MMKVPARAFSVFCPHCQKRAPLESLRIIGAHPGKSLATCGDIFIETTARLNLSVTANNVVIHGRVHGPVLANEIVEVGPTGHVIGDIKAAKIIIHDGAVMAGRCEMTRLAKPEPSQAPETPPDHKEDARQSSESPRESPVAAPATPSPSRPGPLPPPPKKIRPVKLA